MTHQNHQTNGASLEDCHTNFFALTDLCGIKWRKFVNGERPNASSDPLDDPILRSYSRCMQADILCVWRRVQSTKQESSDPNALSFETISSKVHPPLSLAAAKELWIFWYGEEPDLSGLVDAELLRVAANQMLWTGTWERGLTYECRSLLFKALHNLMERFVLTKDIVRFGKWFVQPCTSNDHFFGRSSQHLSFSFTFFVHGDTVCASIDLREHPAVRPLTKEHLVEAAAAFAAAANSQQPLSPQSHEQNLPNSPSDTSSPQDNQGNNESNGTGTAASSAPKPRKVILAPFGMAATLTGNSFKASDPMAEKILEEWASFFPLCNKENSDVPPVVEVISGGHKMHHPSIYVLVTDLDDMEEMEAATLPKSSPGTNSSTEAMAALASVGANENVSNRKPLLNGKQQTQQQPLQTPQVQSQHPSLVTTTTAVTTTNRLTVVERWHDLKVSPYYDTMTTSFTCNTTNTHTPPQAATEMPERGWQDCITNTLHVTYASSAIATTTCSTSGAVTASGMGEESGPVTNVGGNGNSAENVNSSACNISSNRSGGENADIKPNLADIKHKRFWNFVDPTQKAPCVCTKCQSSSSNNKKTSTTSSLAATGVAVNALNSPASVSTSNTSTVRISNAVSMAMAKSIQAGTGSIAATHNSNHHHHQQHHHHHRASTTATTGDGATKSSLRSHRIPFHKRQQFATACSGSGARVTFLHNKNSTTAMLQNIGAVGDDAASVSAKASMRAATSATYGALSDDTLLYQTSDTIPKPRTLHPTSGTPHGTPHGGASTYSRNSIGDSMPVPSVGSPGTPAPSPHPNPNSSLSQPTSVPPADQLLNMSPRAPTSVTNLQQPTTPLDQLLDKNTPAPTPTDQHDNKSITASPYVHPTPSVEAPPSAEGGHGGGIGGPGSVPQPPSVGRCTPTIAQQQQSQLTPGMATPNVHCGTISIKKFDGNQQALTPPGPDIKLEPGLALPNNCNRTMNNSEMTHEMLKLPFKLPQIKVKDFDSLANDDSPKFDVLYDFTFPDAWVNHPMKRFKPNEVAKPRGVMRTKNLYEGHTHSKPHMLSPGSLYGSQSLSIDASSSSISGSSVDNKTAGGNGMGGGLIGIANNSLGGNNGSGAGSSAVGSFFQSLDVQTDSLQGTSSPCKEMKSSGSGNLFTAEGLNPSLNDLEQLFETSSNDECGSVQIHTPPDSNNPSTGSATTNTIDDLKRSTAVAAAAAVGVGATAAAIAALQSCPGSMNAVGTVGVNSGNNNSSGPNPIQAEDLTKMFPTPPSHEQHHPNSSPCQMDVQMTDLSVITPSALTSSLETGLGISGMLKIKQEYSVELGSPVEEPIDDWSYVFVPPKRAKFVGSSKYAPLKNLPSQTQPPLAIPSNCVYKPSWTTQKSRAAAAAAQAAAVQQQQQQQQHQQLQQQLQQPPQQLQQLHELLSAAPRTPLQQPRTPLGPMQSPMHPNTVQPPLNSGGNSLLMTQLSSAQAAMTNNSGLHLLHRAGMSPISPAPASVPFPRGSPMMQPQRHPPPPYEMAVASPATSTSSYLNKQFNSQEHPQTPQSVGMSTHHAGRPLSAAGNPMNSSICANTSPMQELPEVSSLIVNILLYDTALNVFRDHNFDSSTVCVCNADSQKVGNIRGADSGVYVPLPGTSFNPTAPPSSNTVGTGASGGVGISGGVGAIGGSAGVGGMNMRMLSAFGGASSALDSPASMPGAGSGHTGSNSSSSTTPASNQHITGYVDDDPVDCTCGFSAVVNRRLAYHAGLFHEDEVEITNIGDSRGRRKNLSLLLLNSSLSSALVSTSAKSNNALMANSSSEKISQQADQHANAIFDLLLEQCSIIQTSSSSIHRALQRHRRRMAKQNRQPQSVGAVANLLEFVDANDIICLALEQARLAFENNRMDVSEYGAQHQLSPFQPANGRRYSQPGLWLSVHKWPYIRVGFTRSNKEIVRTMNSIQPMLQNAFHSKSRNAAGAKDATYTVSGPLTWRQFHRLAGRASGQCEPQPIPSVIVGHDKDWISVAPLAIHYWDKFLLEPYSYARDVVYLIMCPDNEFVVGKTKTYFKELSTTYEMCKLGRHTPMRGWDGVLTIGPRAPGESSGNTTLDDWLRTLSDTALAEEIRLYADAFQNMLTPYLNRIPGDKTLLNPPEGNNNNSSHGSGRDRSSTSPGTSLNSLHGMGGGAEMDKQHISPKIESNTDTHQSSTDTSNLSDSKSDIKPDVKPTIVLGDPLGMGETMEDINPPAIVLYVVEPFTFGSDSPELERLACIALLRCYSEMLKNIPDSVRANINIQIISLESILELGRTRDRKRFSDEIKCLALNIFSQCRRHLVHAQTVKSLTGFGTAANMEAFLKSKDENNRQGYKMYTPPYILAPSHEKNDKTDFSRASSGMRGVNEQKYSVMYCNYCLSEDQSWLLATVTDDRGELLEKVCINIDVPNRIRRRKAPARRIGLKKLMDFILGLISQTVQPWRLVIGRIGRIGHGELKSWSYLLSKPNLQKASKQLKDMCKQCTLMYPPSILSACLVTLEPDSKLRVMPDQFTPDERFSQISMQNPLSTPQDVTCTHILVFPTSAVCLSFTRQFQNEPQVDLDNDFLNFDEEDENEGFTDLGDLLDWDPQPGRMSNHCSPDRLEDNRSWHSVGGNNFNSAQQQDVEEVGSINQQPLAVGYMVSTAPTGRMPAWFWAACPHLEDVCPVFLKTALHLHVPNIQSTDDILNSTNAHSSATDHPLDSSLTADVLRYVLEGYNALSWLALDSNTHDRLSCLPINVQTLMDLYYLVAAIA